MKISVNSPLPPGEFENGFGHAISFIYPSLQKLGYQVTLNSSYAPVQFHWQQPHNCYPIKGKYNILYFPWESTELKPKWLDICNQREIKEVWTTSNWCKKIFEDVGIDKPIFVYPHGIDHRWKPKLRERNGPTKFLVVDCEANRKGAQEAFDIFVDLFGNTRDASLTMKTRQVNMVRWFDQHRRVHRPDEYHNVTSLVSTLPVDMMRKLYYDHDVVLYLSSGEGWSFIPFQMLASGAPAVVTEEWCHYKDYLNGLGVQSTYKPTKWPGEHPGYMPFPDLKHAKDLITEVHNNYDAYSQQAFKKATSLHKEYDWVKLTSTAFSELEERIK